MEFQKEREMYRGRGKEEETGTDEENLLSRANAEVFFFWITREGNAQSR